MPDIRNPTTNETAMETADRVSGSGGNPPHPSAAPAPSSRPAPANLHPIAKGVYGAPITQPILGKQ